MDFETAKGWKRFCYFVYEKLKYFFLSMQGKRSALHVSFVLDWRFAKPFFPFLQETNAFFIYVLLQLFIDFKCWIYTLFCLIWYSKTGYSLLRFFIKGFIMFFCVHSMLNVVVFFIILEFFSYSNCDFVNPFSFEF